MSLLLQQPLPLGTAQVAPPAPSLSLVSAAPSLVVVSAIGYFTHEYQASQTEDFSQVAQTNTTGNFANLGVGIWYFRARGTSKLIPSQWSNRVNTNLITYPLRVLEIQANAGQGQVSIAHDVVVGDAALMQTIQVWRITNQTGNYEQIASFTPAQVINAGIKPFLDNAVVNGTRYDYYFRCIPNTIDYTPSQSNVDDATPQAGTPTLSPPTSLNAGYSQVTQGAGTFTWGVPGNAQNTVVTIRLASNNSIVASGTVAAPSNTFAYSGFTVGVAYIFEAQATATGYNASTVASTTQSAPNLSVNTVRLESYGNAPVYYKPLDGRKEYPNARKRRHNESNAQYKAYLQTLTPSKTYPLLNVTGYSVDNGLSPNTSRVVSTIANTFTANDVGKRICLIDMHQAPELAVTTFIDDYYPSLIINVYATVTTFVNGTTIIVDRDINGGSRTTPVAVTNGQGYIFSDFTAQWEAARIDYANNGKQGLQLQPWSEGDNFTQVCYVIPEYKSWTITRSFEISCFGAGTARVKMGFEDYYQHERSIGTPLRNQGGTYKEIFTHDGGAARDLILNYCLLGPHSTQYEAATITRAIVSGRRGGGTTAILNCMQLTERHALDAANVLHTNNFIGFHGTYESGGTLQGTGLGAMRGVSDYAYTLFKNYEQRQFDWHTSIAANGGSYIIVGEDVALDNKGVWISHTQFNSKINSTANAYDGFHSGIVSRKTSYLPYVLECDKNTYQALQLGGSRRQSGIFIQGTHGVYSFLSNHDGYRSDNPGEFVGYWEFFYRGNRNRWNWDWANGVNSRSARTAGKIMLLEQIPEVGQRYTISREYKGVEIWDNLISQNAPLQSTNTNGADALPTYPAAMGETDAAMIANTVRTVPAWTTIYQDYADNFTNADPRIPTNGKPLALQPGDRGTIPHYIDVNKQVTAIVEGETITSGPASATVSSIFKRWETRKIVDATGVNTETSLKGHRISARIDAEGVMHLGFFNRGTFKIGTTTYLDRDYTDTWEVQISNDGVNWTAAPAFTPPASNTAAQWGTYTISGYTSKTQNHYVRYRVIGKTVGDITRTTSEWRGFIFEWRNRIWLADNYTTSTPFVAGNALVDCTVTAVSTHNTATVYMVLRKDWLGNGTEAHPAEVVMRKTNPTIEPDDLGYTNNQSYRYWWCMFDTNLPADIGITFEFKISTSVSQELLTNPINRDTVMAYLALASLQGYGYPNSSIGGATNGYPAGITLDYVKIYWSDNMPAFKIPPNTLHDAYTQIEVGEYYNRVGSTDTTFYRQNSSNQTGFEVYSVTYNGVTISTCCIGAYAQLKVLIDCINWPNGEWGADDGVRQPVAKRFSQIDHILKANGVFLTEEQKTKIRGFALTNSFSLSKQNGYQDYYDIQPTNAGAPDMPAPCRAILTANGL